MVGLRTKVILIEITIFRLKVAFDLSVESDGLEGMVLSAFISLLLRDEKPLLSAEAQQARVDC